LNEISVVVQQNAKRIGTSFLARWKMHCAESEKCRENPEESRSLKRFQGCQLSGQLNIDRCCLKGVCFSKFVRNAGVVQYRVTAIFPIFPHDLPVVAAALLVALLRTFKNA